MCRFAAYTGSGAPLSALVYDPPHSLEHQAYAPREMLRGHVNVDGTGIAWWPEETDGPPLRYVSERPPWADANLPTLAPRLSATMMIAAIRSATPGVPFGPGNVAPFVHGRWAGTHNGWLGKFRERTGRELAGRLSDELHASVDAVSDSLLVFLTVMRHLDETTSDLADATRAAVAEIYEVCGDAGAEATLNLVIGDGERIVAVRSARGTEGNNPLYLLQGVVAGALGTFVASEPLDDDPAWQPVADDQLIEISGDGFVASPLSPGSER